MMLLALLALAAPSADPAAVIGRYYELIDHHHYADARALWSDGGRASGRSLAAFRHGFARTRSTTVTLGRPGRAEGAAGSLYVTVPVTVRARLTDGTRQRFAGAYVLRRINDVSGSTPAQRRWHIASARLRALPPG